MIKLGILSWTCPECGANLDLDVNAAINIRNEGKRIFADYYRAVLKKKNRQMNVQFRGPISDTERGSENDIKTGRDTGDRPRYEHFWINAERSL